MLLYVTWIAIWRAMFDPHLWTDAAACRVSTLNTQPVRRVKGAGRT
jgi:hypothetical protein